MHDLSGAQWRKASLSSATGDNCVELAGLPGGIAVRDSKDPEGPVLTFTADMWRGLTTRIRRAEFDL